MEKDSLESLEQHLELMIETSRQIGIISSNFSESHSEQVLNQKLHTLNTCLRNMDRLKDEFSDIKVPVNVFEYIDDGKNPQLYTKDCLIKTLKKNEEVKGKIVAFDSFRNKLIDELKLKFPNEYETYVKSKDIEKKTSEK
jgi:mediator of RNA polymerase II transcription subunit 10